MIDVGAVLDQELAQPPVPMKRRTVQFEIFAQRVKPDPARAQEADGADVAVVGAPL